MKKIHFLLFALLFVSTFSCSIPRGYVSEPNYDRLNSYPAELKALSDKYQSFRDSVRLNRHTPKAAAFKDSCIVYRRKSTYRAKINDWDRWNYFSYIYFSKPSIKAQK